MTKLIGVLGGTSWPSTILPYRKLNEHARRLLGGHYSARILLYSIDYHAIKSRYHDGWEDIPHLLKREVRTLLAWEPDCWMLANNTLHKAYDLIADELESDVPFFHAVDLVSRHLVDGGLSRVLLLGTRFTMENGFFAAPIEAAGIEVVIPALGDREKIQAIQTRLAEGEMHPGFSDYFKQLLDIHSRSGCEAVVTACTELPLVITQSAEGMAIVDPIDLQTAACAAFAFLEACDEIS